MKIKYLFVLIIMLLTSNAFSAWNGPTEIVSTPFGTAPGQIGIEYEDSFDKFAKHFIVDKNGNIIIGDEENKRILVFKSGSVFFATVAPNIDFAALEVMDNERILVNTNGRIEYFNYQGVKLNEYTIPVGYLLSKVNVDLSIFYHKLDAYYKYHKLNKSDPEYLLYSLTGELLKTYTERPLELGKASSLKIKGQYKSTVAYPDAIYNITADHAISNFTRDLHGYLYDVTSYTVQSGEAETTAYNVYKYDRCGKEIGKLTGPVSQYVPPTAADLAAPT